jgi:hypothetical protein
MRGVARNILRVVVGRIVKEWRVIEGRVVVMARSEIVA